LSALYVVTLLQAVSAYHHYGCQSYADDVGRIRGRPCDMYGCWAAYVSFVLKFYVVSMPVSVQKELARLSTSLAYTC
jgi:hypothetical protein